MTTRKGCCCGGQSPCERDCIWQAEIESGCCHKDDTLLLWCERPGSASKDQRLCFPPPPATGIYERCCVTTQAEEAPIQAIYHYHDCYFRCIKNTVMNSGFPSAVSPPEICPPEFCWFDYSQAPPAETVCGSVYANCAQGSPTPSCSCNDPVLCGGFPLKSGCCNDLQPSKNCITCCDDCEDLRLSAWRRGRMSVNDQWKWAVEAICHKSGQDLSNNVNCATTGVGGWSQCSRLAALSPTGSHQCLAIVHFERWWKIAETCESQHRIYIPNDPGNCVNSNLVPKWWIFACSGIPLYAGDLIDAVRFGVISAQEADDVITALGPGCDHPSQATLRKLANAGYLRANDWRDEQRQAYQELNVRFPGAGYAAHIQNVGFMHTLGPFRKRMTFGTVGVSTQPLLRKSDVVAADPDLSVLQADGFIAYPGDPTNQADYDYWAERQWVYFRGRPGGWSWAGWSFDSQICPDEELAILNGLNRFDTNCIQALTGGGCRQSPTVAPCGCCNSPEPPAEGFEGVICAGCDDVDGCNPIAIGCSPPEVCNLLNAQPFCEGIRFGYFKYDGVPKWTGPTCQSQSPYCTDCGNVEIVYFQQSFLVGAQRSRDSWLDSVPFKCRNEAPPLPVFNGWTAWEKTHPAPKDAVCDNLDNPCAMSNYACHCAVDSNCNCVGPCTVQSWLGCGGTCPSACGCDPKTWEPQAQRAIGPCAATTECPPHSTAGQIDCIGYTPDCTE